MRPSSTLAILVMLWIAGSAAAHAPSPPEPAAVRVLVDNGDDCGPHAALECGGFDLVALDLREVHDDAMRTAAVAFLVIGENGPVAPTIVVRFLVDGEPKRLELGPDGGTFDRHLPERPYDETRVVLEGRIRLSALGASPGSILSDLQVDSFADKEPVDAMPGGIHTATGVEPAGEAAQARAIDELALWGPIQYAGLDVDDNVELRSGARTERTARVANLLDTAQTVMLEADHPEVRFRLDGATTAFLQVRLEPKALVDVVVSLPPKEGVESTIRLTLETDRGGYTTTAIDVAAPSPTPTPRPSPTQETPLPFLSPLVLLLAWAIRP